MNLPYGDYEIAMRYLTGVLKEARCLTTVVTLSEDHIYTSYF